jgi:hypothetical protein
LRHSAVWRTRAGERPRQAAAVLARGNDPADGNAAGGEADHGGSNPAAAGNRGDHYGRGGRLDEHNWKFSAYKREKTKVEVRGLCLSACTLLTAYVAKADLCIAEGAFFAFHAVRSAEKREIMPAETRLMYYQQPTEIRAWIDRNGGPDNMPLNEWWVLPDRDLWSMGYPKCQ